MLLNTFSLNGLPYIERQMYKINQRYIQLYKKTVHFIEQ